MLRYRADIRTLLFVAFYYALTVFLWTSHPLPLWLRLPLLAVACLFSFFCAVITHNAVHNPVFKRRWLNNLFQVVLTMGYGHPVSSYVPGHNLSHHKWVQSARDVMRSSKVNFRWNLLNQIFFLHNLRVAPAIMKAEWDFAIAMRHKRPRWYRQANLEMGVYLASYAALVILDWRKFLLFVLIPHTYAAWGIVSINFLQHDGCDIQSPYNHSRNFVGRWVNWWTFNNGFHGIHHVYPSLHWSRLPARHAAVLGPHIHPNLEQPSLLKYCWRAFVRPGKRLDYLGQPVRVNDSGRDEPWIPGTAGVPELASLNLPATGVPGAFFSSLRD